MIAFIQRYLRRLFKRRPVREEPFPEPKRLMLATADWYGATERLPCFALTNDAVKALAAHLVQDPTIRSFAVYEEILSYEKPAEMRLERKQQAFAAPDRAII